MQNSRNKHNLLEFFMKNSPIQQTPNQIVIDKNKVDSMSQGFMGIIKIYFMKVVNSTRIPALVDFIFKSKTDALNSAPPADQNWNRLGLEKTWKFFVPLLIIMALWLISKAMYLIALGILIVTAMWLLRQLK